MNKKIFCIGVWDLFHEGHRALLRKASSLGDLTVGIVGDKAVKREKGDKRPIINENERISSINDLKYVNKWILLSNFSIPLNIIKTYDFIIIGEDQGHIKNQNFISYEQKIIFPRYDGVSTSDLIKRIKKL